jgi:hypothetical protein
VEELKARVEQIARQKSLLTAKALGQRLLSLEGIVNDLERTSTDVERDLSQLETRIQNQPGISNPAVVRDMRVRLDTMKREYARIRDGGNMEDDLGFFGILKLPDGPMLVRSGPIRHRWFLRELDDDPTRATYTLSIFKLDANGNTVWTGVTEHAGAGAQWLDLDIQVSPDWRRIGVYRQSRNDVLESEFWCLAKESYERCAGPSNQAPPSPRTLKSMR